MGDIGDIFLYFSLGIVVLWTVRMARSKGKNPLVWGGASFVLMLVPLLIPSWPTLLGMVPMVVLLFLKSPQTTAEEPVPDTVTCPKCHAYHAAGHTYCVNCGWELNRPYTESSSQVVGAATVPQVQLEPQVETETPERATADTPPVVQAEEPSPPPEPVADEPVSVADDQEETSYQEEEVVIPAPAREPVVSRPVNPDRFIRQGMELLEQGKAQEAVDQFSKAIALDSSYLPAWENRAEAYARLGREDKAAEDRQRLEELRKNSTG